MSDIFFGVLSSFFMAIAVDDLWMLCEEDDTQFSLSGCSDNTGTDTTMSDTTVDLFPELALDDTEYDLVHDLP